MTHRVTLIPGDGIGPEVTEAARRVLEASGAGLEWDVREAGGSALAGHGTPLPEAVLGSIKANRVALKGPLTTPVGSPSGSVSVALRKELDLYAGLRPCRWYPGVPSLYRAIDLVIVRENTEGMYTGIEFAHGEPQTKELITFVEETTGKRIREDSGISIKAISEFGSERIARFALEFARRNHRRKVTAGHKANIMKFSDGLFLESARRVAADEFADVAFEDRIIDNLTMQLVARPEEFDVLVLPNLYGDIVSDLCAGLVGGLGVAPGANLGEDCAVFEPVHGSAPRHAGLNRANPTAMMLCGVMLLRHVGEEAVADRVEAAVAGVIADGRSVTYDLKPTPEDPTTVGTSQMADAVIERLRA